MESINIAVIGAVAVGKSTLIERALGLRSTPTTVASTARLSVNNVVYAVSLIELDLASFDFKPDRRVRWPKQINGQIVPRVDGALLLYDVMNRESIVDLPQTLSKSNPCLLDLDVRGDPGGAQVSDAMVALAAASDPGPLIVRPLCQSTHAVCRRSDLLVFTNHTGSLQVRQSGEHTPDRSGQH
jgi:hypothetical protein